MITLDLLRVNKGLTMDEMNIEQMCDLMNFTVIIKDKDHKIIKLNKYAAEKIGISQEDAIGKDIHNIGDEHFKGIYRDDDLVFETKKAIYGKTHKIEVNEEEVWIKVDRIPFLNSEGNVEKIFIMAHNITSQIRTEQESIQLKLLADKGVYLTEIVHNLKNPLSAAMGYSKLAQKMMGGNDLFDKIDNAHQNLLGIITDILNVKNNTIDSNYKPEALAHIVQDVLEMVRMNKDRRILEYTAVDVDVMGAAKINPIHLKQVITNLVNNSIEELHGKDNKKIEIKVRQIGSKIAISIADNGGGIPADKIKNIFSPQFSTKTCPETNAFGTGLGLSFNKRMLELYNGSIGVESQEGQGTVFTFYLPAVA